MIHPKYNRSIAVAAVISVMLLIFFVHKGCGSGSIIPTKKVTTVIKQDVQYDTVYLKKDSLIYKTVVMNYSLRPTGVLPEQYTADSSLAVLTKRFNALVLEHTALRVYTDQLPLDSIGSITITDTMQFNKFKGKRSYKYNYKIPQVTKTITNTVTNTITEPAKRQVYIGPSVMIDRSLQESVGTANLLYKDRKDRIYTLSVGSSINGQVYYGLGSYWKIKL